MASDLQQEMQIALDHHQQGRLAEAEAIYRKILARDPNDAESLHLLGVLLGQIDRLDEGIELIRRAIATNPTVAAYYSNLGEFLRRSRRLDESIAACQRAKELNPNLFDAHYNLGMVQLELGQLNQAMASFLQVIALKPDFAEAHNNLGNVLRDKGRLDEAITSYRQAIALKPGDFAAHSNLGNALKDKGRLDEAITAYRQAIALNPGDPGAYNNLGNALKDKGQLDEAIAAYRQAIALKPSDPAAHSNLIVALHYHPGHDAQTLAEEHRRWNRRHAEPLKKFILPHPNDRDPDRRLRIGYVSPDLRGHSVGRFLLPLLTHHDKKQVEVFAYAQLTVPDATTERLHSCVDGWRSTVGLSDAQAADRIRQDQVDILVDLTMHMANNRLLIFARKPAPVQVTYLAYCSSTGLETMDDRLSDPYLDPPGGDESVYSERTTRLPNTYWCYQQSILAPEVGPLPATKQGHITFACLNNFCKVSEPALAAWVQLLRAMPNSQLLLHVKEGDHRQRLLDRLKREGIDPKRVQFVPEVQLPDYFQLHQGIDIALDPFPFGGGTTTCDALWMGVPVVSLVGKTAVGRGGLSILSNVGLPELVGRSEEEYVRIALDLANDLPRLSELRSTLRQRMERSPLMDAPRFARDVESAYRQMWRKWCTPAR